MGWEAVLFIPKGFRALFLPSSPRKRYAVQEGDTPERITSLFNVNLEDLEKLNHWCDLRALLYTWKNTCHSTPDSRPRGVSARGVRSGRC